MKPETVGKPLNTAREQLNLQYFAEGAAGEGDGAGDASGAEASQSGAKARGRYKNVQAAHPQAESAGGEEGKKQGAAGRYKNVQKAVPDAEAGDQDAAFDALIRGEYREPWQKKTDAIIGRRFAELKSLQEREAAMAPLITSLEKRYGVARGDLQGMQKAIESAMEAKPEGMEGQAQQEEAQGQAKPDAPEEQAAPGEAGPEDKRLDALSKRTGQFREEMARRQALNARAAQVQNAQRKISGWKGQLEEAQKLYPGLDIRRETQNPEFKRLIFSGVPIRHAFEVTHRDEILQGAMAYTAQKTRERLAQDIRARGLRPQENGLEGQTAQIPGFAYERLSKAAKQEIERRALRGEKVNPRDYMDYK